MTADVKARGGDHVGKPRTANDGGERRQYERRSGTVGGDSQKKIDLGWGANEGTAELSGGSAFGRIR
jgi:hypothetical protein